MTCKNSVCVCMCVCMCICMYVVNPDACHDLQEQCVCVCVCMYVYCEKYVHISEHTCLHTHVQSSSVYICNISHGVCMPINFACICVYFVYLYTCGQTHAPVAWTTVCDRSTRTHVYICVHIYIVYMYT